MIPITEATQFQEQGPMLRYCGDTTRGCLAAERATKQEHFSFQRGALVRMIMPQVALHVSASSPAPHH
jgi:hypothetical protein